MTPNPITFLGKDTLQKAAGIFHDYKFDGAPVVDEAGNLVGIFTKTHLYRAIIQELDVNTTYSRITGINVQEVLGKNLPIC